MSYWNLVPKPGPCRHFLHVFVSRIVHCIADCVRLALPQATKWQRIGNQIDAAMILARADFVKVHYGEGGLFRGSAFTDQMIERTKHKAKYGVRMYSQDFRPAPLYRSRNMSPGVSYLYGIALTPSSCM